MSEIRTITCIGCPMGCELIVEVDKEKILKIEGYACNIGKDYAQKEITNPLRMITTVIPVIGGDEIMVSVKTSKPIPKPSIQDCVKSLKGYRVEAPISVGDILVKNVCGLGVDLVATKEVKKK